MKRNGEKRTAIPLFERQSSFFVFASNWKTFYCASFHLNFHYISWGKVFLLHFRLIKHSAQLCWLYVSYFQTTVLNVLHRQGCSEEHQTKKVLDIVYCVLMLIGQNCCQLITQNFDNSTFYLDFIVLLNLILMVLYSFHAVKSSTFFIFLSACPQYLEQFFERSNYLFDHLQILRLFTFLCTVGELFIVQMTDSQTTTKKCRIL